MGRLTLCTADDIKLLGTLCAAVLPKSHAHPETKPQAKANAVGDALDALAWDRGQTCSLFWSIDLVV